MRKLRFLLLCLAAALLISGSASAVILQPTGGKGSTYSSKSRTNLRGETRRHPIKAFMGWTARIFKTARKNLKKAPAFNFDTGQEVPAGVMGMSNSAYVKRVPVFLKAAQENAAAKKKGRYTDTDAVIELRARNSTLMNLAESMTAP